MPDDAPLSDDAGTDDKVSFDLRTPAGRAAALAAGKNLGRRGLASVRGGLSRVITDPTAVERAKADLATAEALKDKEKTERERIAADLEKQRLAAAEEESARKERLRLAEIAKEQEALRLAAQAKADAEQKKFLPALKLYIATMLRDRPERLRVQREAAALAATTKAESDARIKEANDVERRAARQKRKEWWASFWTARTTWRRKVKGAIDQETADRIAAQAAQTAADNNKLIADAKAARKKAKIEGTATPRVWFSGAIAQIRALLARKPKTDAAADASTDESLTDISADIGAGYALAMKAIMEGAKKSGQAGAVLDEQQIAEMAAKLAHLDFQQASAQSTVRGWGPSVRMAASTSYAMEYILFPLGGAIIGVGLESSVVGSTLTKFGLATALGPVAGVVFGSMLAFSSLMILNALDTPNHRKLAVRLVGFISLTSALAVTFADVAKPARQVFANVISSFGNLLNIDRLKIPEMPADLIAQLQDAAAAAAKKTALIAQTQLQLDNAQALLERARSIPKGAPGFNSFADFDGPTFKTGQSVPTALLERIRVEKLREQLTTLQQAAASEAGEANAKIKFLKEAFQGTVDTYWERLERGGALIAGTTLGGAVMLSLISLQTGFKKLRQLPKRYTDRVAKELIEARRLLIKTKGLKTNNIALRNDVAAFIDNLKAEYLAGLKEYDASKHGSDAHGITNEYLSRPDIQQATLAAGTTSARGMIGHGPDALHRFFVHRQRTNFRIEPSLIAKIGEKIVYAYKWKTGKEIKHPPERPTGNWVRATSSTPAAVPTAA